MGRLSLKLCYMIVTWDRDVARFLGLPFYFGYIFKHSYAFIIGMDSFLGSLNPEHPMNGDPQNGASVTYLWVGVLRDTLFKCALNE